jgi:hypothetical protein
MKRIILVMLLYCFTMHSYAQGMYGFEGGIGKALSYKSYYTPAFTGYYLLKISRTIYFGGALNFQRYSFLDNLHPSSPAVGDVISIRQKSSYLFFSPKLDLGIGYYKYFHVHLLYGVGVYTGGQQATGKYEPALITTSGNPYGQDTATFNTTFNIPTLIFNYGIGISERIPTHGYFSVVLSQDFSVIPGKLSKGGTNLNTNYFSFTIGVTHKYPMVALEDD